MDEIAYYIWLGIAIMATIVGFPISVAWFVNWRDRRRSRRMGTRKTDKIRL